MQVSILRDLALVVAGNNLIEGQTVRRFWPDYEIFRYSKECVFIDKDHSIIAPDPNEWLARIQRDFDGLWLDYSDRNKWVGDRMTVGFVGGGHRWLIGAVKGETTELWEGGDELGDRKDPAHKIWKSGYVRLEADWKQTREPGRGVADMKAILDDTLRKIGAFAREQKRDNFAESFEAARDALTGKPVRDPMFDNGEMSRETRQLLQAIGSAWVFGGMGSWNDIGFENEKDNQTYETLSNALYEQLNEAVAAVANSTWPKHKAPPPAGGKSWWQRLTGS